MKPNQRGRFNGRYNNNSRGARTQTIFRNTSLESTGPCGKLRGTALQLHEKYLTAAKDAQIQNDDILAETCYQYADHYMHLQNQAIANEQALHMQQQAPRQQVEVEMKSETPIESVSDQPQKEEESSLKVVDLSVPVNEMNQAASITTAQPSEPSRHISRPKVVRKSTQRAESETISK